LFFVTVIIFSTIMVVTRSTRNIRREVPVLFHRWRDSGAIWQILLKYCSPIEMHCTAVNLGPSIQIKIRSPPKSSHVVLSLCTTSWGKNPSKSVHNLF